MVFYELDMEKHVNLYESANERKNKHIQPTYNNNNNILKKKGEKQMERKNNDATSKWCARSFQNII